MASSERIAKGYSPAKWLQAGKDSGLQINRFTGAGLTGKGISVAIFDKPILSSHKELAGHIVYITVGSDTGCDSTVLACASILLGETCGVAPEAKLYYFAVQDDGKNFYNYSLAMDKLIRLNKTLLPKNKIRIVSISDGIMKGDKNWQRWQIALKEANDNGIIVLYGNNVGGDFCWGGCPPFKNRDNPKNYSVEKVAQGHDIEKSKIILPGEYRTTASNQGKNEYIYWGEGGFSWAISYLAGLYALGLQIDPDLTSGQIRDSLIKTKSFNSEGYGVVNPIGYINEIKVLQSKTNNILQGN